jgi:predicted secreted Zn-dependent protease
MSSEPPPPTSSEPPPGISSEPPPGFSSEPAPEMSSEPPSGIGSEPPPGFSSEPPPPPPRRSNTPLLIRLTVEGLLGAFLVGFLVFSSVDQWQQANRQLASQVAAQTAELAVQQSQIEALQAEVKDLKERWYGSPAIFSPPAIANTDIRFFAVTGTTQAELISSLNNSSLCTTYTCLPDPAAPSHAVAWALGGGFSSEPYYCYSPDTTTPTFRFLMVLPQWSPPIDGSVKIPLVEEWNALEQVIYTHEATHVAIAVQDLIKLEDYSHNLPSCQALIDFWSSPTVFDNLNADQNAFHARLRADCRLEIGCIPAGWMGW